MRYKLVETNQRHKDYKLLNTYNLVTYIFYQYKNIRIKLSTYDLSKGLPKSNPYELVSVFESITVNNGLEVRYKLDKTNQRHKDYKLLKIISFVTRIYYYY